MRKSDGNKPSCGECLTLRQNCTWKRCRLHDSKAVESKVPEHQPQTKQFHPTSPTLEERYPDFHNSISPKTRCSTDSEDVTPIQSFQGNKVSEPSRCLISGFWLQLIERVEGNKSAVSCALHALAIFQSDPSKANYVALRRYDEAVQDMKRMTATEHEDMTAVILVFSLVVVCIECLLNNRDTAIGYGEAGMNAYRKWISQGGPFKDPSALNKCYDIWCLNSTLEDQIWLLTNGQSPTSREQSGKANASILLLEMRYLTLVIMHRNLFDSSNIEASTPDCEKIINIGEKILASTPSDAVRESLSIDGCSRRMPVITLGSELVPCLYFTIQACSPFPLRKKAIALLVAANCVEGIWSSQSAANAAERDLTTELHGKIRRPDVKHMSLSQMFGIHHKDEISGSRKEKLEELEIQL